MLLSFESLAVILVLITPSKYLKRVILDIAFFNVDARRQQSPARSLVLLITKLVVWISASGVLSILWTLETADWARVILRQTFLVLFIIVIIPLMLLCKPYAEWVARTEALKRVAEWAVINYP